MLKTYEWRYIGERPHTGKELLNEERRLYDVFSDRIIIWDSFQNDDWIVPPNEKTDRAVTKNIWKNPL